MERSKCRFGMKVRFGRTNGEHTLGKIVKCNPQKAKIETLEDRGSGRGGVAGAIWNVPYDLIWELDANGNEIPNAPVATPAPIHPPFNPFATNTPIGPIVAFDPEDRYILHAIASVYTSLSPENLSCDGEISGAEVARKRAVLNRKLNALFAAYGRPVDEVAVYKWITEQPKVVDGSIGFD